MLACPAVIVNSKDAATYNIFTVIVAEGAIIIDVVRRDFALVVGNPKREVRLGIINYKCF